MKHLKTFEEKFHLDDKVILDWIKRTYQTDDGKIKMTHNGKEIPFDKMVKDVTRILNLEQEYEVDVAEIAKNWLNNDKKI